MALPTSYMTGNYSKIPQYFEAILNAQAPEKFTVKFIKDGTYELLKRIGLTEKQRKEDTFMQAHEEACSFIKKNISMMFPFSRETMFGRMKTGTNC